jgi:transcriptional regulator with XRE-family HTH domain
MAINKSFRYALLASDIKKKREEKGITLKQVAAKTKLPLATIHRAEQQGGGMMIETIISLCNWLNEPVQKYLTHGNGN